MGQRSVERERFWREAIDAWRRSGSSVRAFCAARGVGECSFYSWRRELERRDLERDSAIERPPADRRRRERSTGDASASPTSARSVDVPAFVAVTVDDSVSAATNGSSPVLEIELAGGDRLRVPVGFDAGTLRAVVESLRGASC